jgi:chlorobactene glucosyltransferase
VLQGTPLPPGWTGKNWACAQLAAAATAELLLFTDADVRWQPGAVHSVAATLQTLDADLLTVWPTQITHSWGERLTVPLMAMAVLGYLPVRLAHDFFHPLAAAANGQCMAFRRPAYTAIGGHAAVQAAIVEDIQLAEHIKAAGFKLRMADGAGLVACRMYAARLPSTAIPKISWPATTTASACWRSPPSFTDLCFSFPGSGCWQAPTGHCPAGQAGRWP